MTKKQTLDIKSILVFIAIIVAIYLLSSISKSLEITVGAFSLSIGVLAIIWTLIAKYSLSPKSTLRLFTNSFLACLIALIALSFIKLIAFMTAYSRNLIYIEYILTTIVYLFFLISAYYILSIGKQFGFQSKAAEIKKIIEKKNHKK